MLSFIALRGVRAHENVKHSKRREYVIYRDRNRKIELLLQLENKQEIMQNNVETQHTRMYSSNRITICTTSIRFFIQSTKVHQHLIYYFHNSFLLTKVNKL